MYINMMQHQLNFTELQEFYTQGYKVSLFMRHAERFEIDPSDPEMGMRTLLTPAGLEQGKKLGEKLSYWKELTFVSSAVERCKQTCRAIAEGAGLGGNVAVFENPLLGIPGAYMDGSIESQQAMNEQGFVKFVAGYMKSGSAPGMRPIKEASEALITEILRVSTSRLNICASHDIFVGILMSYLQLRTVSVHDWVDFLEAVAVLQDPNGQVSYKFFAPLADL